VCASATAALVAAATLSDRYITGRRFLPDKAIDLIDEAASRLRMEIDSSPVEIDVLQRQVDRLRDGGAGARQGDRRRLVASASPSSARTSPTRRGAARAACALGRREDQGLDRVGELKMLIDDLRHIAESARCATATSSRPRASSTPRSRTFERGAGDQASVVDRGGHLERATMVKEEVTADDIAEVVAAWTGIPAGRLLEGETEKLLRMEDELGKAGRGPGGGRARGQRRGAPCAGRHRRSRPADGLVPVPRADRCRQDRAGEGPRRVPLRRRARHGAHRHERVLREALGVPARGRPPGYVGYDEGGQLTEAVRRRPYSVVLLDEVEKAHPEVFDILLQVLDDGRLTDGQGRTVDFRNVILILTSNLGSQFLVDLDVPFEVRKEQVLALVRQQFRPEFLNRLDGLVTFEPLDRQQLVRVADIQIAHLQGRLADRRIALSVSDDAKAWLVNRGFDPIYGARPLRRLVQVAVGDKLAKGILSGEIRDGDEVLVGTLPDGSDLVLATA
jgi:ATP-dependent Clp protease ATP-binding subunit ClpB